MEFRILGPLEVLDDGRPLSIRRGKEQALLVYLLLHANEVIPSRRLIDELWGERPPATAAKILQNAVSHRGIQATSSTSRTTSSTYGYSNAWPERAAAKRRSLCGAARRSSICRRSVSRTRRAAASRSSVSWCSRTGSTPTLPRGTTAGSCPSSKNSSPTILCGNACTDS